jgi:hypothetical protein
MAVSSIRTFCFCFIRRWPVPAELQSQCHLPSSPSHSVPSSTSHFPTRPSSRTPPPALNGHSTLACSFHMLPRCRPLGLGAANVFPLRSTPPRLVAVRPHFLFGFLCSSEGWDEKNQDLFQHARHAHTPSHFHRRLTGAVALRTSANRPTLPDLTRNHFLRR